MKKIYSIFLAIFISGCQNPNQATEENLSNAIQHYLDKSPACIFLSKKLPILVEKKLYNPDNQRSVLTVLSNAGLLTKSESTKEIMSGWSAPKETVEAIKFEVSESGKEYFKEVSSGTTMRRGAHLCYAEYKVNGITEFTEPSDRFGKKVTEVKYTYEAYNVKQWAIENSALQEIYSDLSSVLNSSENPLTSSAELILTNKGWVHRDLYDH